MCLTDLYIFLKEATIIVSYYGFVLGLFVCLFVCFLFCFTQTKVEHLLNEPASALMLKHEKKVL